MTETSKRLFLALGWDWAEFERDARAANKGDLTVFLADLRTKEDGLTDREQSLTEGARHLVEGLLNER